jgi:hypothetical protein
MKRFLPILSVLLLILSCKDVTKQENDLKNEIIAVHDKVMNNDEVLMKNKMKLDTLLKQKKDTVIVKPLQGKLVAADDAMEKWMSKFQPDMTGKSHDEVMSYYTEQKKQITTVDSAINAAISESNKYLSAHK